MPALKSSHVSTQDLEGSEKPLMHLHNAPATLPNYRSTKEQLEGVIAFLRVLKSASGCYIHSISNTL